MALAATTLGGVPARAVQLLARPRTKHKPGVGAAALPGDTAPSQILGAGVGPFVEIGRRQPRFLPAWQPSLGLAANADDIVPAEILHIAQERRAEPSIENQDRPSAAWQHFAQPSEEALLDAPVGVQMAGMGLEVDWQRTIIDRYCRDQAVEVVGGLS